MKYLIIILILSVTSCSFFKKKGQTDKDMIARVNNDYLYASDVKGLTRGLKGKDSADALKNYADSWVRKKLLLTKAEENISEDDIGITKNVEDYHEALVLYEYEKALVNQKLDTTIKPEEMAAWYDKLKDGFPLQKDVYLIFFIKLKKDAPDLDNARKWIMKPKNEDDLRKIEGYSKEYATSYIMDKGMWYERDNVLKNFPLSEGDMNALSSSKNFREFKTEEGTWFIKIAEVLRKDDLAPLPFIRGQIVKAVIEKRRLQLVERVYDKIYKDGLQSKSFEIYVK